MTAPLIPSRIFRAYDIRGQVGQGLDAAVMTLLGRAIGSEALDVGENCLIAGADARLSSPGFHRALVEGILSTGCDVIDIGVVPTPLMYFATHELTSRSGVMVTGSHNPKDYNGVKIVLRRRCLADQQIQHLRRRIHEGRLHSGNGVLRRHAVEDDYVARVTGDIQLHGRPRVVVDCGNGVTGRVAPRLFRALGCEVVPLYCETDGHFPNHHPDPTVVANLHDLIEAVREHKADLGVAFDGDGDRLGLVTGKGRIIDADRMLMAFARAILPGHPGGAVVFDVKSSMHLTRLVQAAGGRPVMCKSGHSFVKRSLLENGALLGGEYSAHIFFAHRWYGFDDGMYAAARFLELMGRRGTSADNILDELPATCSTPELFIAVPDGDKFALMERLARDMRFDDAVVNDLDGLRVEFGDGWGLIRASNTTPNLVLRFEADDCPALERILSTFRDEFSRLAPTLASGFPPLSTNGS